MKFIMTSHQASTILNIITRFDLSPTRKAYLQRLKKGNLTREENPHSHFCVYLAAYDPMTKEVLIGHHKKSDLWLFNGGHIEKDETPEMTLEREMNEEWGVQVKKEIIGDPKLITITHIKKPRTPCREHLDIWYFIPVSKHDFKPDTKKLEKEFHTAKWVSISQAFSIVTDPNNRLALRWLSK